MIHGYYNIYKIRKVKERPAEFEKGGSPSGDRFKSVRFERSHCLLYPSVAIEIVKATRSDCDVTQALFGGYPRGYPRGEFPSSATVVDERWKCSHNCEYL